MVIRPANEADLSVVLDIERRAFGDAEGPVIADLVAALVRDPTAAPLLSLMAEAHGQPVGHILFTTARITGKEASPPAAILAPLAVVPEAQRQGIGGRLIREGLRRLTRSGVALVFVLGYPDYYGRFGFRPAGAAGFDAPYPIPLANAEAWMVQERQPGVIGRIKGTVQCAAALDRPEHWRE
jgi:predicted N-acetyltransferase YhbS